uniref:lipid droplet-associated hydrolase isoform X1 n=1 Tax=Jaculus jaculus TaxID=51337 RepID=UPI000333058E|nr:lipid droplet-associated hydrolase isoform X1 [Jaculus jaculus]XP_045004981.1 lipid droplet-associated hydrolase isoform X1 [Jaculus jaculus]XP_045004982.1 lipid droplet-associated hydrolase isoform X1 [Jaculus jaculus]XP_045004983.1 lipid droplet-associated hydrolase isoform X1 [Jaculus jaculus]
MDSEIKEDIPVHEEFVLCGGVETQILKCGPWTDLFNEQSDNRSKLLIFIIPGNPGFSPFYVSFAKALHALTNKRFPVWAITYAGFAWARKDKKVLTALNDPNTQEIKDVYGLNGQIEHKIAFLRTYVPKEVKLILIGHSIGSYIALQILKRAPELPVIHTFLLFPTIERMSESPNGRIATPLLCWFRYVLYAANYLILKPCPEKIKLLLIKMAFQVMNLKNEISSMKEISLTYLLHPFCLANAAYLGGQEMMQVVKRDDEIIKEHLSKLTFYYSQTDPWCPMKYYEDIKKAFPEGDIRLCEKKIPHSFVIHFSQEVACLVAEWLNNNLSKM